MRGAKPPRVNPNGTTTGAVLPTHAALAAGDIETRRPWRPGCCCTCKCVLDFALLCAAIGILVHLIRTTDPVVSVDAVSATGLVDAAAGATDASPSFDVAVRLTMRWFHLAPSSYRGGTVGVSWAGGAVTASGPLQDVYLDPINNQGVAKAKVRAAPAALPADARERLEGELRRGEVRLDLAVAYNKDVGTPLGRGLRARCAAVPLGRGNSTASCTVVK